MSDGMVMKPQDVNEKPNEDVVAALDEALAMAKSGRIRSIAIAATLTGNCTYTSYETRDLNEAIGLVGFLHHTLCASLRRNTYRKPSQKKSKASHKRYSPHRRSSIIRERQVSGPRGLTSGGTQVNRTRILETANEYVTKDRAATHGDVEGSFAKLAAIWGERIGVSIRADQVAIMMLDLKTVRAWDNPKHLDNWIDMAGYAACGGEVATKD